MVRPAARVFLQNAAGVAWLQPGIESQVTAAYLATVIVAFFVLVIAAHLTKGDE